MGEAVDLAVEVLEGVAEAPRDLLLPPEQPNVHGLVVAEVVHVHAAAPYHVHQFDVGGGDVGVEGAAAESVL